MSNGDSERFTGIAKQMHGFPTLNLSLPNSSHFLRVEFLPKGGSYVPRYRAALTTLTAESVKPTCLLWTTLPCREEMVYSAAMLS